MLIVRLAGDQQYGKKLFTWLSLVMSLMVFFFFFFFFFFLLSFFPLDVLIEIWDISESVSEGFSTYFYKRWPFLFFLVGNVRSVPSCFETHGGSWVMRWYWVNFQCRGVLQLCG